MLRPVNDRLLERFISKVRFGAGCWEWTAGKSYGYGQFAVRRGHNQAAHRFAYELWVGPIPEGLVLDHLCRNTACVRPSHLEPVTQRTNVLRGETLPAAQVLRTHCPAGHPYDAANTYRRATGIRQCRACGAEQKRRRHATAS